MRYDAKQDRARTWISSCRIFPIFYYMYFYFNVMIHSIIFSFYQFIIDWLIDWLIIDYWLFIDVPERSTSCSWCGRTGGTWEPVSACEGTSNPGLTNSNRFCSEACFAAGRRAAFKRARTCDWCRHVRHSVSYVDFHVSTRLFFSK